MTKVNNNQKKGFASFSPEKQAELRAKSVATRRLNKEKKALLSGQAAEKRAKANEYLKKAEMLQQEADELDGENSSDKYRKKHEAELVNKIDERFRDSVAPQYLKIMKQHAIHNKLSVEQLVTPSYVAMDILYNPNASVKEKQEAMKLLQQFENSKPQAKVDEESDVLGTAQEEFDKLMGTVDIVAPKR